MSKLWSQNTTLSAANSTTAVELFGAFNFTLSGTFTGSVQLQRSFDGGANWSPLTDATGSVIAFTAPYSLVAFEPEQNVLYRATVTALSAGSVTVRLSQ